MSARAILLTPEYKYAYDDLRPISVCLLAEKGTTSFIPIAAPEYHKWRIIEDNYDYLTTISNNPEMSEIIYARLQDYDCTTLAELSVKNNVYKQTYFRKRAHLLSCILDHFRFHHWVVSPIDDLYQVKNNKFTGSYECATDFDSLSNLRARWFKTHLSDNKDTDEVVEKIYKRAAYHDKQIKRQPVIACFESL